MSTRAAAGGLLELVAGAVAAVVAGAAAGWLSRYAYVLGTEPLLVGLAAGAAVSVAGLWARGGPGPRAASILALAVLCGAAAFHAVEDHWLQATWWHDYAATRMADSGMPIDAAVGMDEDELAFYAEGAEEALAAEVARHTDGSAGLLGRQQLRAQSGLRLLGPWTRSRGLDVGAWAAWGWWLLWPLVAWAIGRAIVRRVGRAAAAQNGPP